MAAAAAADADARPIIAAQSQDLFSVEETIQQAAYAGNLALVAMLLRKGRKQAGAGDGVGAASKDLDGRNAVHWAAAAGHLHVLEHLRDEGGLAPEAFAAAVRNADDAGWTALHSAVSAGHTSAVQFLLEHGADPAAKTKHGRTALHYLKGNAAAAALLTAALQPDDLNQQDETGNRALHRAAARGEVEVCRCLLASGARIDAQNGAGDTALHVACYEAQEEVARLLVASGASVDIQNNAKQLAAARCASQALRERVFVVAVAAAEKAGEEKAP